MPELIAEPSRIEAAGQPPKVIAEWVGLANTAAGAECLSGCLPAFSPGTVHHDS